MFIDRIEELIRSVKELNKKTETFAEKVENLGNPTVDDLHQVMYARYQDHHEHECGDASIYERLNILEYRIGALENEINRRHNKRDNKGRFAKESACGSEDKKGGCEGHTL